MKTKTPTQPTYRQQQPTYQVTIKLTVDEFDKIVRSADGMKVGRWITELVREKLAKK